MPVTYEGPEDSFGRYWLALTISETSTDAANNRSSGTYSLRLWSHSDWTFFGHTTTGSVTINGTVVTSWNTNKPSAAWAATGDQSVLLASGNWGPVTHNADGSKVMAVSATMNATGTPDSYGPGSVLNVSGSPGLTNFVRLPGNVAAPGVTDITANGARITWIAPSSPVAIEDYELHVCRTAAHDSTNAGFYGLTGSASTSKDLAGLQRNTQYYAALKAKSDEGLSASWSPWTGFMTSQYSVPTAPTGYSVSDKTSTSFYTTMPAVADNGGGALDDIQIQYNTTASGTGSTSIVRGAYAPILVNNLTSGGIFYYRMRVHNSVPGGGWSLYGGWVMVDLKTNVPTQPTSISVSGLTSTGFTINWAAPASLNGSTLTGYYLRVATDATFSTGLQTFTLAPTDFSKVLTALSPGGTYYYQLWATSNNGPGGYSNVAIQATTSTATKGLYMNIGGTVKFCEVYMNVGGVIKLCEPFQNVAGVIKAGVQ